MKGFHIFDDQNLDLLANRFINDWRALGKHTNKNSRYRMEARNKVIRPIETKKDPSLNNTPEASPPKRLISGNSIGIKQNANAKNSTDLLFT